MSLRNETLSVVAVLVWSSLSAGAYASHPWNVGAKTDWVGDGSACEEHAAACDCVTEQSAVENQQ